jgi:hypothetical protein
VDLARTWVMQETGLSLDRTWKLVKSRYKGGSGEHGSDPVPFPVDDVSAKCADRGGREQPRVSLTGWSGRRRSRVSHCRSGGKEGRTPIRPLLRRSSPRIWDRAWLVRSSVEWLARGSSRRGSYLLAGFPDPQTVLRELRQQSQTVDVGPSSNIRMPSAPTP